MEERLKNRIHNLSDSEIEDSIKLKETDFQPGVYKFYIEEAKQRGIDIEQSIEDHKEENPIKQAPVWKRIINHLIDFNIVAIIPRQLFSSPIREGEISPVYVLSIILIIYILYYVTTETLFNKTLGKFITKTQVITDNGNKPHLNVIINRTLGRLIPFNSWVTIFTGLSLHERVSKTKCINDKDFILYNC